MARMPLLNRLAGAALLLAPVSLMAQVESPTPSAVPAAGSLLKMGLMLAVVILMFFAFVWIMKRMSGLSPRGGESMKITGGLSLGQRERLLLVEVDNHRLLLGVTAQNISLIRELGASESFGATLKQAMPEAQS